MATNKHTSSTSTTDHEKSVSEAEYVGSFRGRNIEELLIERSSIENALKELNKIIAKRLIDLEL